MKLRNGFVSNSSSSSFCLYGYRISNTDIKEFASNFLDEYDKYKTDGDKEIYNPLSEKFDYYSVLSLLDRKYSKSPRDIELACDWDSEVCYYGRDPESLRGDETGKEFKESILYMKKLFMNLDGPECIVAEIVS